MPKSAVKIQFCWIMPSIKGIFEAEIGQLTKPTKLSDSALWETQKYFLFFAATAIANMKKRRYFCNAFREKNKVLKNGAVVQSVRISACHAGGREFESRPHRKKPD